MVAVGLYNVYLNKEEINMDNKFEFYWNDLTEECQKRLYEFLGGENGNYDAFPFAVLYKEDEPDEEPNG